MQLVRLIRETKYLDRMGFRIPETALNVSLQEEKYYAAVQSLENMVQVPLARTHARSHTRTHVTPDYGGR
jgi:hypothetical protein